MTVAELIVLLQARPNQEQRVVVQGYEGGYVDLTAESLEEKKLQLFKNSEWYYGPHESPWLTDDPYDEITLCLFR